MPVWNDNGLRKFYGDVSEPEITPIAHKILTEYSHIPETGIVKHVKDIRNRAWSHFQYPCIGTYRFLHFSISRAEVYPAILEKLRTDPEATLLDLGCCFGQDIRKLVFDGVPGGQLAGTELEERFVDLGYELFRDKETLEAKFVTGDFLGGDNSSWSRLEAGSFDCIHAAAFFHLFTWDEQVEAMSRALRLLKPKAGSIIFGRQFGVDRPSTVKQEATRSGEMYQHSAESFRKLIEDTAGKLGVKANVQVVRDAVVVGENAESGKIGFLNYTVTLEEA